MAQKGGKDVCGFIWIRMSEGDQLCGRKGKTAGEGWVGSQLRRKGRDCVWTSGGGESEGMAGGSAARFLVILSLPSFLLLLLALYLTLELNKSSLKPIME